MISKKTESTYIKLYNVVYQVPRNNLSINLVDDHFLRKKRKALALYRRRMSTHLYLMHITCKHDAIKH